MSVTAHPPDTTLGRFGIETYVDSADPFVAAIPMAGLINPVTGMASVAPLAVLVDYVAGLVNHYRRADDEWTVSSELSIDLGADALAQIASAPDVPVVASARPFGHKGSYLDWPLRDQPCRRADRVRDGPVGAHQTSWCVSRAAAAT